MNRRLPTFRQGLCLILLLSGMMFVCPARLVAPSQEAREGAPLADATSRAAEGERILYRLTEYSIQARIPIFGDIGCVGAFFIEEEVCRNGESLDKTFRIFGHSTPELARKGRDYSGELRSVRKLASADAAAADRPARREWQGAELWSSGYFKKNGVIESERIVFYPDHAVSQRENGEEKRVVGVFGSLVSALQYFLENEVEEGDVYESAFILGGHPYIFLCEVGPATFHEPSRARVFPIEFTTLDGLEKDSRGRPKITKKKGGIRVWLSKKGPYDNVYLRLLIQYRWYLSLQMEYLRAS